MAQRAKGTYRGQRYTRPSLRPGRRTVHVRGYCRRKGIVRNVAYFLTKSRDSDMPF